MPSWNDLLNELDATAKAGGEGAASTFLQSKIQDALNNVGKLRGDRNVLLYGSAFLQKPQVPPSHLQITAEEVNALMGTIYGMDWAKGLTLILHTPGGVTNATESIVDYLRSKFDDIEVIVPTFAMSAGTMIALASNRVVMGRQSQLGPIDPQMVLGGRSVSAQAIVDQFTKGKAEIIANPVVAHAWAPVLQSLGPALLVEAQNALDYSETMVARWLEQYMFKGRGDAAQKAKEVAHHFSDAGTHKSHGRRINMAEAAGQELVVEALESSQDLQEQVLTAYHLMTLTFEKSIAAKVMFSHSGRSWVKNYVTPEQAAAMAQQQQEQQAPQGAPTPPSGQALNRADRRSQGRRKS